MAKEADNPLGRIAILKSLILSKLVNLWLHLQDPSDTWIKKLKTTNHRWKQIACQMYQDMDNIHTYGPSIYSKEVHSNRFWEDTFKVYELF